MMRKFEAEILEPGDFADSFLTSFSWVQLYSSPFLPSSIILFRYNLAFFSIDLEDAGINYLMAT